MAKSIKEILVDSGVLAHVILPREIDHLLSSLEATGDPVNRGGGIFTGDVHLADDMSKSPIPGFDFALTLPTGLVQSAPYKIKFTPEAGPTSFQFWVNLADQGQAHLVFKFVGGVPGLVLTGAAKTVASDGTVSLEAYLDGDPKRTPILVSRSSEAGASLGSALLISGSESEPASIRFTPDTDSTKGVVAFGLEPSTVVFGSSKIGFECPVLVIDDSEEAKAEGDGAPSLDPPLAAIQADTLSWRGILARKLDFYLPADMPLFGGHPINGYLAIGRGEGANLVIESKVPASPATPERPERPGYSIRIECLDPTAKGLSGLVPTLISATMELPLSGAQAGFNDQNITFAAGKPVRVTATFARDPVNEPDKFKIAIGVAAQGQDGLVSVKSETFGGAKIFNTAAAMATALIVDQNIERNASVGNTPGVFLHVLLAAGTALSSLFEDDSSFVLHGVEIESSGHGAPVGGPVVLTLDYSVSVRVTKIDVGVLKVEMKPDQPMRIRVRSVRMSVDPSKSGLSMIGLDFDHSQMEIENPGAWNVNGLDSLFDVLGSRSGRGSTWIEVDLRFKLNLGPISVSGATIRATLNSGGGLDATIRGLEASLTIPGAIEGKGQLRLKHGGFEADLLAKLLPLNVSADAGIIYVPATINEPPMILLRLDVDLPAAIPLANSGFGLFGIGGLFGLSAEPDYGNSPESDPVLRQLQWQPENEGSFKRASGQSTFGLSAVVGTLPDLGFSFSAKVQLLITVPDVAVRGALNGRVMHPVVKLTDPSYPPDWGISFLGFIGVDSEALSFGVLGNINLKPLLEIKVPLAGYFPFKETDDWYIYLGADGAPVQGRSIGPITATVLPDILNIGADAYVMMRGKGIEAWPYGRALPNGQLTLQDGFVLAFGFSLQNKFGVEPIVWAELYASLDLLIGAKPPTLAGFGRAGGSLNLGPFSLGVEAQVYFMVREGESYFWAEVTGRIELLFFDIEGKVTIAFGEKPSLTLPDPDLHPLNRLNAAGNRDGSLGVLTDDSYRVLARLVEEPTQISDDMRVWPDAMVSLPFAIPPEIKTPDAGAQFPDVGVGAKPSPAKVGSEMLYYKWHLDNLELFDVTGEADPKTGGTKPVGQLAARWQVPRGSTVGGDVSELVLFSNSSNIWINRLADGGEGLTGKPLQQAADVCNRHVMPEMGWAIGLLANQETAGFRLPPEQVSQNPLISRVEARMHHFGITPKKQLIPLDEVFTLPQPFSLDVASLIAWPKPEELKHRFLGHIVAPNLHWLAGLDIGELINKEGPFAGQQINLDLAEPITDGLLLIIADRKLFDVQEDFWGLRIFDNAGHEWSHPDLLSEPTGKTAGLYQAPTLEAVGQLRIAYPLGAQMGVAGIGGITVSASAAAVAENKAIQDETARLADAAAAGPKTDNSTNFPHQRVILEPGRLYRIDIDMSWEGEISKQDENGNTVLVDSQVGKMPNQSLYTPKGTTKQEPTKRSLFFKTTPKPEAHVPVPSDWLRRKQDVFQPEMIVRYLSGYEPGQSEEFRFCDDPLRAHFTQDHVPALAKAYGFTILVEVRRVDWQGPANDVALQIDPKWGFATNPNYLSDVDKLRYSYAVASKCNIPTPGATATVNIPLEPEVWYDIHLLAKADNNRDFLDGHLPGVTFKTSRWRTPQGMFAGLGFTTGGEPDVMVGDLVVALPAALGTAVIEGDDQAFQNALLALGIEGWPVTDVPRLSRLWVPDPVGVWLFAGLMVESPEPIHRPGRVDLEGLTLDMRNAGSTISFDIRRRDRSGSRLIYLTSTPFAVVTSERIRITPNSPPLFRKITPQLVLKAKSTLDKASTTISGSLVIPLAPGFSEDP
jgi:hypothetical protein